MRRIARQCILHCLSLHILSSLILKYKKSKNCLSSEKKFMIRMMPKTMIMQMISQKNLGMEITIEGMTMLMITWEEKRLGENGERNR